MPAFNGQYLIFTSGLIGIDSSRDWAIKWHSDQINSHQLHEPILQLISRFVREEKTIAHGGELYQHTMGLAAIFPHQDHLQRHSYFVIFLDIPNNSTTHWQAIPLEPRLQTFLDTLHQLELPQQLKLFDEQQQPLPNQLDIPLPSLPTQNVTTPTKQQTTIKQSANISLRKSPTTRWIFGLSLTIILFFLATYDFSSQPPVIQVVTPHNTTQNPSIKSPVNCQCYWQWWQTFYDHQYPLFQQWQAHPIITQQQCQQACQWTGQTLPLSTLLTQMHQANFWQLQYPIMEAKGCSNANLYQALSQCSGTEFNKFFKQLSQQCGTQQCN